MNYGTFEREQQKKLMKGLLDLVIVKYIKAQPIHGYQIITCIRKNFGVYLGPSTIYPLLNAMEAQGIIKSQWQLSGDRPRKVYTLTTAGSNLAIATENMLNLVTQKIDSIRVLTP